MHVSDADLRGFTLLWFRFTAIFKGNGGDCASSRVVPRKPSPKVLFPTLVGYYDLQAGTDKPAQLTYSEHAITQSKIKRVAYPIGRPPFHESRITQLPNHYIHQLIRYDNHLAHLLALSPL